MSNAVWPWHYQLCDAIIAKDIAGAKAILDGAMAAGQVAPNHPVDRAMRLLVAKHLNDPAPLAEAEATLLAMNDLPLPNGMDIDGRHAALMLAGLMRLADDPARAAAHFEGVLALRPDFLPARVELECLRRGADRSALFAALGETPPRADWRYLVAAAELGLDSGIETIPTQAVICMRGQCTANTPAMLRLYRYLNPGVGIILSTWTHTPPEVLNEVQQLAMTVVIEDTHEPGSQNKNRQMMLARGALITAQGRGPAQILMTRTDLAFFMPNIVPALTAVLAAYPPARPDAGRLVVPDAFTRKFREYHLADIMCFGAFTDVVRYWSAPFEEADFGYFSTETYLGWHLAAKVIGDLPRGGDHMRIYRQLLRDFTVVRDLDWLEGFWMRHPEMRNSAHLNFGDKCLSQGDWERLYFDRQGGPNRFAGDWAITHEALRSL